MHKSIIVLFLIFLFPGISLPVNTPKSSKTQLNTTVNNSAVHYPLIIPGDISNVDSIPDYYQNDTSFGGFPDKGQMYCAPAAISNSLMQLIARNKASDTLTNIQFKKAQYSLINKIASASYIGTGPQGTNPTSICKGVEKYLLDNNYSGAILQYHGWRPAPYKYRKRNSADLETIKITQNKHFQATWLNIGWYSYQKEKNEYFRTGGHWVTLIHFINQETPMIIVHDPATKKTGNDTISLTQLTSGLLTGKMLPLPVSASGYYRFVNSYNQFGIIDGFVTLEIP